MISLIIPVFNQEAYLEECISSILNQSCQDFEIILVNDGSVDNSKEICKRYEKKIKNIYYYEQVNAGVSVARNLGLQHAKGEWIMFVDPDDFLKPDILSCLLKNTEEDTDIVACCCEAFDEEHIYANHFFRETMDFETPSEKKELLKQLLKPEYGQPQGALTAIGVPWGKIYRSDMLRQEEITFHPKLRRMQDNVFNMNAFWAARKIKYVDEMLYCYRLENIKGYFRARFRPFLYENYVILQKERKDFLEKNKLWNDAELVRMFYEDSISQIIAVFNSYVLHAKNADTILMKRKKLLEILQSEDGCYREAIQELHFADMTNRKHAVILLLFKTKSFVLLYTVWKIYGIFWRR